MRPFRARMFVAVGPLSARHGRLEIEMTSGIAVPIRAGSDVVGVQLEGEGTWRYAVDDRSDLKTFAATVASTAPVLVTTADRITSSFTSATVLFGRPAYEPFWSGDAPGGAASGAAAAGLRKTLEGANLSWTALEHRLPEARYGGGQYVYAEFEGKTRVGYIYDGVRGSTESLVAFREFSGVAYRYQERLSTQLLPAGRGSLFELQHVDVKAETGDNRSGTITGTLRLRAQYDGARLLELDLVNNRDPKSERWDSTRNALTVQSIANAAGEPLPFSHRCGELLVDLGTAPAKGTTVEIRFALAGEIFTAIGGNRDDTYISLWGVSWFPIPEQLGARRFTFTLEVRTKKPYRPISTGDQISLVEEGNQFVLTAKSDVPVWEIALFAGKYTTKEIKDPRWTVRAHGYGVIAERDVETMARTAAAFMEIYEARLGPCPFKEVELVELPTFAQFGISPPGLIMVTSRSFKTDDPVVRDFLGNHGANSLIAHEVAHQWFGHRAWPVTMDDNWLTESPAEYVAGLAMGVLVQQAKLDKTKVRDFKEMLAQWRTWTNSVQPDQTIAGANHIGGEHGWEYRMYLLYNKGPLVLHMYRALVGEERFYGTLRKFLDDANTGPVDTGDFVKAASAVVGQDMHWFFDQWIYEPGIPEVSVSHQVLRNEAGQPTLNVNVAQENDKRPFKKIHIPLIVEYPDGQREVKLAFQQERRQRFDFPLKGAPSKVTVDPGRNNLADYQ